MAMATGIGSHPGDDPIDALRLAFDMTLPYLPELPARGPGADMIGRAAGMLVELPVELRPSGWRLAGRPGRDVRRARDLLARDLDALEEVAEGYDGRLKVAVAGPWTLAAAIELPSGEPVLSDPGAVRDLAASLTEGTAAYLAEVRRRVPGSAPMLQLDEPGMPRALAGAVPTASGLHRVRPVEEPVAAETLRTVLGLAEETVVHCCTPRAPVKLFRTAGAPGVSLDITLPQDEDALAVAIDSGATVFFGTLPAVDADLPGASRSVDPVRELWRKLGFGPAELAERAVVTPRCGLAGASAEYARRVLELCADAARSLSESP